MIRTKREMAGSTLNLCLLVIAICSDSDKLLVICQVLSILTIIFKVRNNQTLVLISIFFMLYAIPSYLHYFYGIGMSAYTAYNSDSYYHMVLLCQTVFLNVCAVFLKDRITSENDINFQLEIYDSPIAYWFCVFGVIVTIIIGRSGQTIFNRGGYGASGVTSGSALFEYCYIFYTLAYIFCGDQKGKKNLLKFLFIIYAIKALLFGARIEILAMLILVYILFYQNRFKTKTIIMLAILAYALFAIFGSFRSNLTFSFDGFGSLYGYSSERNRIVNNESEVFYTSSVLLASIKTGFVDLSYRINALMNYIIRLVIPSSLVNKTYNVVPYLQQNFSSNGGGGFFSAFLYFYGSWVGVVLGGGLVAMFWNKIREFSNQSMNWRIFALMSVVMTPRWFAYSPESIVKIPLYTVVGFVLLKSVVLRDKE